MSKNMDGLEKKSKLGLERYRSEGNQDNINEGLESRLKTLFDGDDDFPKEEPAAHSEKYSTKFWLLLVLGAVFLGYLGYKYIVSPNKVVQDAPALFAQYFEPFPDAITNTTRGDDEQSKKEIIEEGMGHYNSKSYVQASRLLLSSDDGLIRFYGALSSLASSDAEKAIEVLEGLNQSTNYLDNKDAISWYLGLSYLKANEIEKAKIIFEQIANSQSYKKNDAQKILEKI